MNLSFDIGHPGHFHFLKNFITHMKSRGHDVFIHIRAKDVTKALLEHSGLDFVTSKSTVEQSKSTAFQRHFLSYHRFVKGKKIDLHIGTSVVAGLISKMTGSKYIGFSEDDFSTIPFQKLLGFYPSYRYIRPVTLKPADKINPKIVYHNSYHELAYLHPNNFKPDPTVLQQYDLQPRKYVIARFSALKAHHDIGAKGMSAELWNEIQSNISDYKIVMSVEGSHSHQINPWDMHHIMAHAKMIISSAQTTAVEAAMLGVPSVRQNSLVGRCSIIQELEHTYQLTYGFKPEQNKALLGKVKELMQKDNLEEEWQAKRGKLLDNKIDFNRWMIEYFEQMFAT